MSLIKKDSHLCWSSSLHCTKSLQSCLTLWPPWTVARQASLSMGFSRQEYWSGLPFPSPGDLPDPGIKPGSPALEADALTSETKYRGMRLVSTLREPEVTEGLWARKSIRGSAGDRLEWRRNWGRGDLVLWWEKTIETAENTRESPHLSYSGSLTRA